MQRKLRIKSYNLTSPIPYESDFPLSFIQITTGGNIMNTERTLDYHPTNTPKHKNQDGFVTFKDCIFYSSIEKGDEVA